MLLSSKHFNFESLKDEAEHFVLPKFRLNSNFRGFCWVVLNGAAVDVNKNLVKILVEQNVRPHLSASDATLTISRKKNQS